LTAIKAGWPASRHDPGGASKPKGRPLEISELNVLRWLHILAVVYWLGREWGVFQTSYHVVNRSLPLDERRRHMETA